MVRASLLVDGDVGGEVLGDGVDLAGGVAEVLVALVPELPVLLLVVLDAPATPTIIFIRCCRVSRREENDQPRA